ncbi:MAG TPA: dihydropteroate synthase, partial [Caldithrix sp.]|nr:dihydropteroate synthase [Caldithrix sp.]
MQIKPVYLSSPAKIIHYQNKYHLDPQFFWQDRYVFELGGYSASQKNLLKTICQKAPDYMALYEHSELNKILIHFMGRKAEKNHPFDLLAKDDEVRFFFIQMGEFFSEKDKPIWHLKSRILDFNQSPFIMGILNMTPDSFSDGGKFSGVDSAVEYALSMIEAGADIIDIGGESTRPGSEPVSVQQEINRVVPVIEQIKKHSDIPVSVDTYKSRVAEAAIKAGADIVNDISGCTFDEKMPDIIKTYNAPIILMHIKGTPKNMQVNPEYEDVILEVYGFLSNQINILRKCGIHNIAIDPGIGFGKRLEDNLKLLNHIESFKFLGYPVLIGASRKSFLGYVLDKKVDQRLYGSLSVAVLSALKGADI